MGVADRITAVRQRLGESGLDAYMVCKGSNVIYLTDARDALDDSSGAVCVITAEEAVLYTSFIYSGPTRRSQAAEHWTIREIREGLYENICTLIEETGSRTLAIEASVPYGRFRYISERFTGNVEAVDQWVEDVRIVKEPEEIRTIARACALTDEAFDYALGRISAGRTEAEIALEIEVYMRENGSEGVAFPPIVAAGDHAADPHAKSSERLLRDGELVKLDFGSRIEGYCSDMTRTVAVGRVGARQREMHAAVLAANEAACTKLRPGMRARDIDKLARDVIASKGFGKAFGHGLGHGVGLEVHEAPRIGPGSDLSVPSGSVITIEPGVYIEGEGGVRIEDLAVVTAEGAELLTLSPRELIEL